MPKNIPIEKLKQIPPALLLKMINKAKEHIKKSDVMQRICEEYGQPIEVIDLIPTYFKELDVSAKTDHGVIYLNFKLLEDADFFKDYSYLIHEYSHFFQQCFRDEATQSSDDGSYLDNEFEQEGFQNQIEYIAKEHGEQEADDYVENLLDHHEIEDEERDEKKEVLMGNV